MSLCGSSFLLGSAGAGNFVGVLVEGVGMGAEAEVEIGVKVEVKVVVRMVEVVTGEDAFGEVGREVLDDASGMVVTVAEGVEVAIVVEVIGVVEVIV